jgi:hypothetical protein
MRQLPSFRFRYFVRPAFAGPATPARSFRDVTQALRVACHAANVTGRPFAVYVRRRGYPLLLVALARPGEGIAA